MQCARPTTDRGVYWCWAGLLAAVELGFVTGRRRLQVKGEIRNLIHEARPKGVVEGGEGESVGGRGSGEIPDT